MIGREFWTFGPLGFPNVGARDILQRLEESRCREFCLETLKKRARGPSP